MFKFRFALTVTLPGTLPSVEFARTRDVGAGRYGGMVVDIRQRPTRLLRRGRQASKEAGDPEADAAFVGQRTIGKT